MLWGCLIRPESYLKMSSVYYFVQPPLPPKCFCSTPSILECLQFCSTTHPPNPHPWNCGLDIIIFYHCLCLASHLAILINLSRTWHQYRVDLSLRNVVGAGPPPTCTFLTFWTDKMTPNATYCFVLLAFHCWMFCLAACIFICAGENIKIEGFLHASVWLYWCN